MLQRRRLQQQLFGETSQDEDDEANADDLYNGDDVNPNSTRSSDGSDELSEEGQAFIDDGEEDDEEEEEEDL